MRRYIRIPRRRGYIIVLLVPVRVATEPFNQQMKKKRKKKLEVDDNDGPIL
jgi:hypothetical protein